MDSGNVGKARDIALDVMTSLEDWQKCMEPYWFIYEDYQLSPVGSGNLAYLLKHVEQFRQGVGVEKVDKNLDRCLLFHWKVSCGGRIRI